jgi:hypothetical protein
MKPKIAIYLYSPQTEESLNTEILNILKKTTLGETSQIQFAKKISQWVQYIPDKTLNTLISNPEESIKYLEDNPKIKHSPSNHHLYISSIVGYLTHIYPTNQKLERWKQLQKKNWEPLAEHYLDNKPSEHQKDKQIKYDELLTILKSLEIGSFERLLIAFYTLIEPIRADYYATEILKSESEVPTEENYLLLRESGCTLCINDFKTKGRHDSITNELSQELLYELNESLKKYPRNYLFVMDDKKTPFTRKLFSNWACRTLSRILKQPMTLTVLRHVYITHKLNTSVSKEELKETAKKMGHTRSMQQVYEWRT